MTTCMDLDLNVAFNFERHSIILPRLSRHNPQGSFAENEAASHRHAVQNVCFPGSTPHQEKARRKAGEGPGDEKYNNGETA